jgi:hypothetical protein
MMNDQQTSSTAVAALAGDEGDSLAELLAERVAQAGAAPGAAPRIDSLVGTIVGFTDHGATPLVLFAGQPSSAAQRARTTVRLDDRDLDRRIVLMFEEGDPARPIIIGCLREPVSALPTPPHVEMEADGNRLIVTAKERLVLRCGSASITLTQEGKVLIQGAFVSSQSSGVLRIRGGSVQIN